MNGLEPILSVGIDVGTTSTHLTLSRLTLSNTSRVNEPSRLTVTRREILYQSAIFLTPLTDDGIIDGAAVQKLIRHEYAQAGFAADQIATGAVIITGETAKRRNAEVVVRLLAELAGKFVAASAGPNLESILAARGSGAAESSREGRVICNIDIGGGTTNLAVCKDGAITFTDWIAVGGRTSLALADECAKAAQQVLQLIEKCERTEGKLDEVWISGGVGEVMMALESGQEIQDDAFNDAGVILARELLNTLKGRGRQFHIPSNAIRATVIGAGAHSLQLSGSTIGIGRIELPLTDVPVLRVLNVDRPEQFSDALKQVLSIHDLDWRVTPAALVLPHLPRMGYLEVKQWANALASAFSNAKAKTPLIIITGHDIAAALGQLIGAELPEAQYVVLDGIDAVAGDFIDIGAPLAKGLSIPVVIKEFVFSPGSAGGSPAPEG